MTVKGQKAELQKIKKCCRLKTNPQHLNKFFWAGVSFRSTKPIEIKISS